MSVCGLCASHEKIDDTFLAGSVEGCEVDGWDELEEGCDVDEREESSEICEVEGWEDESEEICEEASEGREEDEETSEVVDGQFVDWGGFSCCKVSCCRMPCCGLPGGRLPSGGGSLPATWVRCPSFSFFDNLYFSLLM